MRMAIGVDHGGYPLKEEIKAFLTGTGHQVEDLGAHAYQPEDDYPDFAQAVAQAVASGRAERGVIVCGSGVGASVAANKVRGIRAAVCHDTYSAAQGVQHDDMNVLCLGARIIGPALATELVRAFTDAWFDGGEKYQRRLDKVLKMEGNS